MYYRTATMLAMVAIMLTAYGCDATSPPAPGEPELLDGPIEGLSTEQHAMFLRGDAAFAQTFTVADGLGPIFVANQCSSCHPGDGRGHPFVRFTRFGQSDETGNKFLDQGGPQLQHKAIPGFMPEVLPAGAPFTDLIAPPVTGLGFLDAVSDEDLIALSDEFDIDGDGISGRPHWNTIPEFVTMRLNSIARDGMYISRFGKKANAYDLLHQTAGAYNQDMGITSLFASIDPHSGLEEDPEVSTQVVNDVVFYLKTLKAPISRDQNDATVASGKQVFGAVACVTCHVETMRTGYSPISQLSNKVFHPYTDMLLHDMGAELDDGYTEGYATTAEWRTPPLWGLGLSKDSQGGSYFLMHDGRATSISQAIELHGGEANRSREAYRALSEEKKQQLITFLESL